MNVKASPVCASQPPVLQVSDHGRANGYKTYIVTGGGQDFVRVSANQTYGIARQEVVGKILSRANVQILIEDKQHT
jgi:hypothetical protein